MKRPIITTLGLILFGVISACQQQEIALYDQTTRLNFKGVTNVNNLTDEHYVSEHRTLRDSFQVILQGDKIHAPRTFALNAKPDEAHPLEVILDKQYTYTALQEIEQKYYYEVKIPDLIPGERERICVISFDYGNPAQQFEKGLIEKQRLTVITRWNLKPRSWDDWSDFGSYSEAKYKFIMDVLQTTYDNLPDDALEKVKAAYEEYKTKNGGPIKDENGADVEF